MEKNLRFEYLDSIRGLSAISVLFTHGLSERKFFHGYAFGVIEFFLLSSFLLTFHMIKRFENARKASQSILNVISSYFVMRFFRIYVPFILFCLLATSTDYNLFLNNKHPINLTSFLLLEYSNFTNSSYLWTIPVEIAYYFFIPFISYLFNIFKMNYKQSLLIHLIIMLLQIFMILIGFEHYKKSQLMVHFPVFLAGSSVAILYKSITDSTIINQINDNKIMTYSISIICFVWFVIGSRLHVWFQLNIYHFCIFWSTHMLLMLISSPNNYFTLFLEKFSLLKAIGKYSFGFYLFHGLSMGLFRIEYDWLKQGWLDNLIIKAIILNGHALLFGYLFFNLVENNCINIASRINAYLYNSLNKEKNHNIF